MFDLIEPEPFSKFRGFWFWEDFLDRSDWEPTLLMASAEVDIEDLLENRRRDSSPSKGLSPTAERLKTP